MPESLNNIIVSLKKTKAIQNNPELLKHLTAINKYCLSEESKAYFLGLFFKHKCLIETIDPKIKSAISENIRAYELQPYFTNERRYIDISLIVIILAMSIIGSLFLIMGLEGISNNETIPTMSHSRLSTTTDTAIGKSFVGAAILIGVAWTLSYNIRRKELEKDLLRSN